jgi:hypothetical protein
MKFFLSCHTCSNSYTVLYFHLFYNFKLIPCNCLRQQCTQINIFHTDQGRRCPHKHHEGTSGSKGTVQPLYHCTILNLVHSVQQKSSGLIFRMSCSGSDVTYSCHHNSSRFSFPTFVRGVSLSSIHNKQSCRIYINKTHQYIRLN